MRQVTYSNLPPANTLNGCASAYRSLARATGSKELRYPFVALGHAFTKRQTFLGAGMHLSGRRNFPRILLPYAA